MSLGRKRKSRQPELWVPTTDLRKAPGHRFYESLNRLLRKADFDERAEANCAPYYQPAGTPGRPSIPAGVYFRMLLVGYFEGIDSERGICWRCADSLSLREFLGLELTDRVPDHSTLSRTRQRLPLSVFEEVFGVVLALVAKKGLLKGRVLGVDSTYLAADASMKSIVRRDTGETYKQFIERLATEAGVENPTEEQARRLDRKRKGKKTSNTDWQSPSDSDARIARMKDGRTKLAYKPEHVVDLETGAIVAAPIHPADVGDTASIEPSLEAARRNLDRATDKDDEDPTETGGTGNRTGRDGNTPKTEVVADKGYHKAELLGALKQAGYRTYIPEREQEGYRRWTDKGGAKTAAAFYENRARITRRKGKRHQRWRSERVERSFAHLCESGGLRRTRLRGRDNVQKRYLLHAAAANLGLIVRTLFGHGTPRGFTARIWADLLLSQPLRLAFKGLLGANQRFACWVSRLSTRSAALLPGRVQISRLGAIACSSTAC